MNKKIAVIMILLIVMFLGFGIIIPILPEIVSAAHLAVMLAVYSAASFIMSPVWGGLSDRIGRKPVIVIGSLGFSVSFLLFGLFIDHLFWMYVSRLLGGLFSGAVISCAVAYVSDVTSEEERTKAMGLVGMSIGIGFIFGPAVGGLLSYFGHATPFFIASAISFFAFMFVLTRLDESLPAHARRTDKAGRPSRWSAFTGRMKYLYMLAFIVSFTLAGLEAVLLYFQQERIGATSFHFGMMLLISGIVGASIQGGVVRRFIKKGDEPKFVLTGLILCALGYFLLLLSDRFLTATLYLCIFSSGNALLRPCVTSLITQKTTVGQGVATGLSSSMDSLGRIIGPLLGASLFYIHSFLPFIVGGIVCLGSIGFLYRFLQLDRQHVAQKT